MFLSFVTTFAFTFCTMLITKAAKVLSRHWNEFLCILYNVVHRSIPQGFSFTDVFCEVEQGVNLVLVQLAEDDDVGWIILWKKSVKPQTQRSAC